MSEHESPNPSADGTPDDGRDDALVAALIEIEHHIARAGWDQPARLFALVRTDALIRQEPSLAQHLRAGSPDSLSSIEQEDFVLGEDPVETFATMQWPASVSGCALMIERSFLPPQFEADIPEDADAAADFVHRHPERQDARVIVGVLRDGEQHAIARLKSHPEDLLGGAELAPGLTHVLAGTLS